MYVNKNSFKTHESRLTSFWIQKYFHKVLIWMPFWPRNSIKMYIFSWKSLITEQVLKYLFSSDCWNCYGSYSKMTSCRDLIVSLNRIFPCRKEFFKMSLTFNFWTDLIYEQPNHRKTRILYKWKYRNVIAMKIIFNFVYVEILSLTLCSNLSHLDFYTGIIKSGKSSIYQWDILFLSLLCCIVFPIFQT